MTMSAWPLGRAGMEWQSSSNASPCMGSQRLKAVGQGLMVGAMDLVDPANQLGPVDRSPPQRAMAMCPRWDQSQPVSGARSDRQRADPGNRGGIDLFLVAIAVDYRTRHRLDNRANARRDRPPGKPVDQRVLKRFQRSPALRRIIEHRRVIVAARMRYRQEHRQRAARSVDYRGRIAAHVQQG